jgi:hypothetical protein
VTELPTQAGLPIFDDENDDVSWLEKRRDPPPPPPPFEEPPVRPLFAPDDTARRRKAPEPEQPETRPGGGHRGPKGDDYWPFPGQGSSSGSGTIPAYVDPDQPADATVPGRRALRLAGLVALVLLALIVLAIAFNLSRGRTPLGGQQDDDPTGTATLSTPPEASPDGELTALEDVVADDFDPQGDPPEENPDDTANAIDGDPDTSWSTSTYQQQLGPGGLKSGVGLLVDLGTTHEVEALQLDLAGDGTAYEVFLTDDRPADVEGLTAAGTEELPDGFVGLSGERTGRYLVLWLTALPPTDDGRFRGEVVDLRVLATP